MEFGKEEGKAELYSCEPGAEETGEASEGVALEQLVVLCERGLLIGENRSGRLGARIKKKRRKTKRERKSKTKAEAKDPPFHESNPKGWGTPLIDST